MSYFQDQNQLHNCDACMLTSDRAQLSVISCALTFFLILLPHDPRGVLSEN